IPRTPPPCGSPTARPGRARRGRGDMRIEPLHADGEMRAAFVVSERMNFIDDQPAHLRKMRQPFLLAEEHTETFRRRQQNMRRLERLARPLMRARIASAQRDANR